MANMLCGHLLGQWNYHDTLRLTSPVETSVESLVPRGHTYQRNVYLEQGALSLQVAVEDQRYKDVS